MRCEKKSLLIAACNGTAKHYAFAVAQLRGLRPISSKEAYEDMRQISEDARRLRYDNLKSAAKKILRGYQREETERFIAFRSHWGFQSEFCNPASGHEKGGVENEGGYFRRNHLVPIPAARDWAQLNEMLLEGCRQDEHRTLAGHTSIVGVAMAIEREQLQPLRALQTFWTCREMRNPCASCRNLCSPRTRFLRMLYEALQRDLGNLLAPARRTH